jgi:hypothetical protein
VCIAITSVVSPGSLTAQNKKGVASRYIKQAAIEDGTADVSKLTNLNITWAYNWSITPPPVTPGLSFVPMLWDASDVTPANISALANGKATGQYDTLLGFNEPDSSTQANMTPEQAIALWPQLESTGLRLGSPAVTDFTTYSGKTWLTSFMTEAGCDRTQDQINQHIPNPNCRVAFIAVHLYRDWTSPQAASNQIRTDLINLHSQYDLPVWITEIGTIDTNTTGGSSFLLWLPPTESSAESFMSDVTSMMNQLTWVERYAWMSDYMCDLDQQYAPKTPYLYSSLYNCHQNLTGLGQLYQGL